MNNPWFSTNQSSIFLPDHVTLRKYTEQIQGRVECRNLIKCQRFLSLSYALRNQNHSLDSEDGGRKHDILVGPHTSCRPVPPLANNITLSSVLTPCSCCPPFSSFILPKHFFYKENLKIIQVSISYPIKTI